MLVLIFMVAVFLVIQFAIRSASDFMADFEDDPVRASAELMVRTNPDLEMVESNPEEGTLTMRIRSEDKTVTVSYAELQDGRLRLETSDGETVEWEADQESGAIRMTDGESEFRMGQAEQEWPAYLEPLRYPGPSEPRGGMQTSGPDGDSGVLVLASPDSFEEVAAFYEEAVAEAGMERHEIQIPGQRMLAFSGESDGTKIQLHLSAEGDQGTVIQIYYGSQAPDAR